MQIIEPGGPKSPQQQFTIAAPLLNDKNDGRDNNTSLRYHLIASANDNNNGRNVPDSNRINTTMVTKTTTMTNIKSAGNNCDIRPKTQVRAHFLAISMSISSLLYQQRRHHLMSRIKIVVQAPPSAPMSTPVSMLLAPATKMTILAINNSTTYNQIQ